MQDFEKFKNGDQANSTELPTNETQSDSSNTEKPDL